MAHSSRVSLSLHCPSLISFAALLCILAICSTLTRADEPASQSAAVDLHWKFTPGQSLLVQIERSQHTTTTAPQRQVKRASEFFTEWLMDVEKIDDRGTIFLSMSVRRARFVEHSPEGDRSLDTKADDTTPGALADEIRSLARVAKSIKVSCQISAGGEVIGAELDAKAKQVVETEPAGKLAKIFVSKETLRETFFRNLLSTRPERPVRPGDSWSDDLVITRGTGEKQKLHRSFTYRGHNVRDGKTFDLIETKGTLDLASLKQSWAEHGIQIDSMDQDSRQTELADLETHFPAVVEIKQSLKLTGTGGNGQSVTQDDTIQTNITVSPYLADK